MAKAPHLVCIVDDDPSVRRALGRMVKSFDYQVKLYSSGLECLDDPEITHAACMITDVSMPGIDGFELHKRLVAEGIHVPTIFISAHRSSRSQLPFDSADFVAFLDKPCEERVLYSTLTTAINHEH